MSELPAPNASMPDGLVEPSFDANAMRVLKERYFAKRADGSVENPRQFLWRVASAIAEPERPYAQKAGRDPDAVAATTSHAFYGMMARRDFMPNTPCLVNAGRPLSMLSACFVLPVPDSIEGIFDNLKAMALIQKSGGGCVSADSRVWTTFCGLEPIEVLFNRATIDGRGGIVQGNGIAYDVRDLGIRTLSMDGLTGKTGLQNVSHVWKFDVPAEAQIVVRTREGVEVQTSCWHPFMVLRGREFVEIRADALTAGDVILGPERPDDLWPWTEYQNVAGLTIDENIGWLIGFTLGDGSFGYVPSLRQERLRWFSGTTDVLDRVRAILSEHGSNVGISKDPRGNTLCVTTLKQRFVAAMLAACGFAQRGPKDARIRIPEHIGKSPLSVVRAFVAGLLDSGGTVAADGSPSYTTVSREMAHDLAALMSLLGYRPTLRRKEPYGRGKQATYTVLLCPLPQVNELAGDIALFMSSALRKGRLRSDCREMTALALPFGHWRDALYEFGLVVDRGVKGAGPLADELNRWSCNYARRVRRDDLARVAETLAPHDPSAAELLRSVALRGQEIESVAPAERPMAYYDLTVDGWNTYASGRTGLALIHNTGFAFSELRHQGAEVVSTGKDASGPVSFMKVFNAATDSIKQGGVRRGANMGVLKVDHPDIFHFMSCKKELDAENRALWNRMSDTGRYTPEELAHIKQELLQTQINNFNISIGVTDAFMSAVKEDGDFELLDPRTKNVVRTVRAREIWDAIVEGAWQNGEPGVLFLDHPGVNPLPGLGPIQATNPCLTADTMIAVADGRGQVSIGDLAAAGLDVPVFCADPKGAVAVRMMRHPRKTGDKVPVFKVTLDDGSLVRATANHKLRLRDGAYCEVRDLKAGDSLSIMTKFLASIKDVFPNANSRSQDYWWVNSGRASNKLEHRYIAEFAYDTRLVSGYVVHHRDYNAQNNAPANLAIMTRADHDALHSVDMIGDRNPMRRPKTTWSESKWAAYRAKHSANNIGAKNKRYGGVDNERLRDAALDLTKRLGRRFSTVEWEAYALERALPQQFSGWRRAHLNGSVMSLSKWAALQCGFIANVDPRVMRHFEEALEQGYDAQLLGGFLTVLKRCELCDTEFSVPYVYREVGRCSRACSARQISADPAIRAARESSRSVTLAGKREAVRANQLRVYLDVQAREATAPSKRSWVAECLAQNVSSEISRESSPFRSFSALRDAASFHNHRVVSVEPDGFEDVFNGTVDEFHNFFHGGFDSHTKNGKRKLVYVNSLQCGEQFLHGHDSCNLGSINVGHFYDAEATNVDWDRLGSTTALAIRFLDNVIDANIYPIDEIRDMVTNNRRVGLGVMGFADLLIQMQIAYGSPEAIAFSGKLMEFIQLRAQETSETLARERGDFPNKHLSIWANEARPRRNAALLSVAPTGTISMIAGCSFGCEPYFGMAYTKHVMKDSEGRPQHLYYVVPLFEEVAKDEGFYSEELLGKIEENRGSAQGIPAIPARWQAVFTTSADVTVDQHIDMLAAFQKWTDNAVSKTINAPNDDTRENVARAIFRAYEAGCKGFTYYRDGSRTEQVVTFSKDNDLKGGNRDITAPVAGSVPAVPAASAISSVGTPSELDIDALLAKANALLEVR
jgi:ribonucleotide reductase alpha subunit